MAFQVIPRNDDTPTMLRHLHPFGSPTYEQNYDMATRKSIPKWQKRARLGVCLGQSPNHAQSSIALVLKRGSYCLSSILSLIIFRNSQSTQHQPETIEGPPLQDRKAKGRHAARFIRRSILLTMSLYVNFIVSYDTYRVRSHLYIVSCNCDIAFVYTHCV